MNKIQSKSPEAKDGMQEKYLINEQIKSEKVYVITHEGENLGLIERRDALQRSEEAGLDLVQVGERDEFPVTKIMDFGKFVYAKKKQVGDAKKHHKVVLLKEVKLRPNIGDQDYRTKLKRAEEFFTEGNKVKFTLQFKGREITMMDQLAPQIFQKITTDLAAKGLGELVEEKDQRGSNYWSKIYFVKSKK